MSRTEKTKRRSGRPGRNEAPVGKEVMIRRARELLRHHGPAKLSLREIARAVRVDPSLIRYYFGDKNGLFTEVVQTILDEGRIVHQKILQSNLSPAEKIRARIEIYLETIFADPYQHQMIVELILYGRKPSAAVFRKKMVERAYAELKQLVQQSGATVEGAPADARFLHVAILGMCEYFITGQPLVRELFRSEPYSKALVNQYGRFIGNLVVRGLGLE